MSPFQVELAEFIRRLKVAEENSRAMRRDLIALRQGMRDAWTEVGGVKVCLTTITGKVVGCDSAQAPLPNSILRVVGHATGTAYGSFVLSSGTIALDLVLDPADTSLDLYATGPGVRFVESAVQTKSVTVCGSTAVGAITTKPATGYHCQAEFAYPLADTLNVVDPVFGNRTASWAVNSGSHPASPGAPLWWSTAANVTTVGGVTCPSATTPLIYSLLATNPFTLSWWYKSTTTTPPACPNTAGPTNTGFGSLPAWRSGTLPDASVKMDLTWSYPSTAGAAKALYGDTAGTVRIYEP